jgi:phosphoribosylformylglycinamidine synthase
VVQVRLEERDAVFAVLREAGLSACSHVIGKPTPNDQVEIYRDAKKVFGAARADLQRACRGELAYRASARQPRLCR